MRIYCLALLSFLLLVCQVLLVEGKREGKNRHASKDTIERKHTPGLSQAEQRSQSLKRPIKGKFVTQDQADCRWAVTGQQEGISLKVDCTRQDTKFSCVFTGDPTSCLELHPQNVYWKQIGRSLRSQKVICGDSKSVLKTRLCRKNFPEANFKLVSSTLAGNKQPDPENAGSSPQEHSKVQDNSSSDPTETPTVVTSGPECVDDPDVVYQKRMVLEYCGDSWSSLCKFLFSMFQGSTCQ